MKFDRVYSQSDIKAHCGDFSQIAGIVSAELTDCVGRGRRILNFRTGSGLNFTVTPDAGLDIAAAEYKGVNLALVAPADIYTDSISWERGVAGGLLVTAGMTTISAEAARSTLSHGTNRKPATGVSSDAFWLENDYHLVARGEIHEIVPGFGHLRRRRSITVVAGEPVIHIKDTVTNLGAERIPLQIAHRIQPGFPIVAATARFTAGSKFVTPLDSEAKDDKELHRFCQPPADHYRDKMFIHQCQPTKDRVCRAAVVNPSFNEGLGIGLTYSSDTLPHLTQWKMMRSGLYTMTMEPCNAYEVSEDKLKAHGILQYLEPEEDKVFSVSIEVLEGSRAIADFEETARRLHPYEPEFASPLR